LTKNRNYGPFIWVDLSRFLGGSTVEDERILAWKMIKNGVWLATGEAFRSESSGWFRLTFTVPKKQLRIGMER
jgi:1-aminocyclopropane-1-carboxylate synthase